MTPRRFPHAVARLRRDAIAAAEAHRRLRADVPETAPEIRARYVPPPAPQRVQVSVHLAPVNPPPSNAVPLVAVIAVALCLAGLCVAVATEPRIAP